MSLLPFRSELLSSSPRLFDREFFSLKDDMDSLMNNFFTQSISNLPRLSVTGSLPAVDIQDKNKKYLLEVEVPGLKEDDIKIDFHENTLTVKGEKKSELKEENEGYYHAERRLGAFRRDIPFLDQVDADKIKANLKDGVLHIELLKKEMSSKTHKKIEIKH